MLQIDSALGGSIHFKPPILILYFCSASENLKVSYIQAHLEDAHGASTAAPTPILEVTWQRPINIAFVFINICGG